MVGLLCSVGPSNFRVEEFRLLLLLQLVTDAVEVNEFWLIPWKHMPEM